MTPMPRTRHLARHRAAHRPRSETRTNGRSTAPAVRARTVTAAAGDQPASSNGLTNAPDVPNERVEIPAATRPPDIDESFILDSPGSASWAKVSYTPDARSAGVRSQIAFCP